MSTSTQHVMHQLVATSLNKGKTLLAELCSVILLLHHVLNQCKQVLQLLFPQCACHNVHVTFCISHIQLNHMQRLCAFFYKYTSV